MSGRIRVIHNVDSFESHSCITLRISPLSARTTLPCPFQLNQIFRLRHLSSHWALARWPTFAAVLARAFAMHDGCHFCLVVFLLLSIGYGILRGGRGCGKLSTGVAGKWKRGRFCCEVYAFFGNFRLLLALSGRLWAVLWGLPPQMKSKRCCFHSAPSIRPCW
jgi:hypothetical protein